MSAGFIKLNRCEITLRLLTTDPEAYLLLSLIAYRAKRTNSMGLEKLELGEAMIGDDGSCGLSSRSYRSAKERLAKWNLATFQTTNKGTIAKLTDNTVWDVNIEMLSIKTTSKKTSSFEKSDKPKTNKTTTNKEQQEERIAKEEQQQAAAEPPNAAGFSFDPEKAKHLVRQAMLSWGLTDADFSKHNKTRGISCLFAALQFISEPGFVIRESETQAFFWAVKTQPWLEKKNHPKKMPPREHVEQYFTDGQVYNGAECGINSKGIWFHRGSKTQGANFDEKNFSVLLANALEAFGIENPFKKTFDIKEA